MFVDLGVILVDLVRILVDLGFIFADLATLRIELSPTRELDFHVFALLVERSLSTHVFGDLANLKAFPEGSSEWLGRLMGWLWDPPGRSWSPLGRSWGALGALLRRAWAFLLALLGASWSLLACLECLFRLSCTILIDLRELFVNLGAISVDLGAILAHFNHIFIDS